MFQDQGVLWAYHARDAMRAYVTGMDSTAPTTTGDCMHQHVTDGQTMATGGRLKQLDGLRGLLCMGVIAINMGLYNAGANTPVGVFLVLSGFVAFLRTALENGTTTSRGRDSFVVGWCACCRCC